MAIATGTAIALATMAASSATAAYSAHKQGEAADQASGMQKSLLDRQSGLAEQMMTLGKGQISGSKPALDAAMRHYMTLATGNKGAINAELSPERAGIADTAAGVERGMMARMGPGAQRDQAMAGMGRQKEGALGLLPAQARSDAFGKLASLGQKQQTAGYNLLTGAAGALGGQTAGINSMFNLQQQGNNAWGQFGRTMFDTYGPSLMGMAGKGGNSNLPSKNMPYNMGYLPSGESGFGGF